VPTPPTAAAEPQTIIKKIYSGRNPVKRPYVPTTHVRRKKPKLDESMRADDRMETQATPVKPKRARNKKAQTLEKLSEEYTVKLSDHLMRNRKKYGIADNGGIISDNQRTVVRDSNVNDVARHLVLTNLGETMGTTSPPGIRKIRSMVPSDPIVNDMFKEIHAKRIEVHRPESLKSDESMSTISADDQSGEGRPKKIIDADNQLGPFRINMWRKPHR
jgi:hypothetical protein